MAVVYDKLLNKPLLHRHDPLVLMDSNGILWDLTVSVAGALVITQETTSSNAGLVIGMFPLTLTYTS